MTSFADKFLRERSDDIIDVKKAMGKVEVVGGGGRVGRRRGCQRWQPLGCKGLQGAARGCWGYRQVLQGQQLVGAPGGAQHPTPCDAQGPPRPSAPAPPPPRRRHRRARTPTCHPRQKAGTRGSCNPGRSVGPDETHAHTCAVRARRWSAEHTACREAARRRAEGPPGAAALSATRRSARMGGRSEGVWRSMIRQQQAQARRPVAGAGRQAGCGPPTHARTEATTTCQPPEAAPPPPHTHTCQLAQQRHAAALHQLSSLGGGQLRARGEVLRQQAQRRGGAQRLASGGGLLLLLLQALAEALPPLGAEVVGRRSCWSPRGMARSSSSCCSSERGRLDAAHRRRSCRASRQLRSR
jgi:hypothetical protein